MYINMLWKSRKFSQLSFSVQRQAGLPSWSGCVNLTAKTTLVPEEALGAFIGDNPNGVWTLTIADTTNMDGGSLNNWSVDVVTLPAPPAQVTVTYPSADVPKTITTVGATVTPSVLTVSGAGTQIGRVRLNTTIASIVRGFLF